MGEGEEGLFPHSPKLRWTACGLAVLTWIFSVVVVADCTAIRYGYTYTPYRNMAEDGLFSTNVDRPGDGHRCLKYSSDFELDTAAKAARAFGCMAAMFSSFAMLQILSVQLFLRWKTEAIWKTTRVVVPMATISSLFIFVVFGTGICVNPLTRCLPGAAGIINCINVVLLAILTSVCWGLAPPAYPMFEVKLAKREAFDETVQFAPEDGVVLSKSDGPLPPMPAQSVDETAPDMGDYGDVDYNFSRGTFGARDPEMASTPQGQESMEESEVSDGQFHLARLDSGAEFNNRRGQIAPSTVYDEPKYHTKELTSSDIATCAAYEDPEYPTRKMTGITEQKHRHHHHKRSDRRRSSESFYEGQEYPTEPLPGGDIATSAGYEDPAYRTDKLTGSDERKHRHRHHRHHHHHKRSDGRRSSESV